MSYCRFSSDNWRSDVYAYNDVNFGYTIHVAAWRIVGEIPQQPSFEDPINDEWVARHRAVMDFLETAERASIGLPHDGESFHTDDLAEFADILKELRDVGYRVPAHAIAEAEEELAAPLSGGSSNG